MSSEAFAQSLSAVIAGSLASDAVAKHALSANEALSKRVAGRSDAALTACLVSNGISVSWSSANTDSVVVSGTPRSRHLAIVSEYDTSDIKPPLPRTSTVSWPVSLNNNARTAEVSRTTLLVMIPLRFLAPFPD